MASSNHDLVTSLYRDPSVIVIRKEEALSRLRNNIELAQSQSSLESRLYPLLNRIVSDLCALAKRRDTQHRELQCHSQALFPGHGHENRYRVPDCAACVFDSITLQMFPAFWFEGKALPLHPEEASWFTALGTEQRAMDIFESSIPQLREQAAYAFQSFNGPTSYHVFLLVGIFWSLIIFDKEREAKANIHIAKMEEMAKEKLSEVANNLLDERSKKRRRTERSPTPEVVTQTDIDIPDHLLPQLVYVNEPLVVGQPVEKYNPTFLEAVASTMTHNKFVLQPSWFDVPPNFKSKPDLDVGMNRLRVAYERPLRNDMSDRTMAVQDDLFSPPQDTNDLTYRGSRANPGLDRSPYPARNR
ncbi:hypothetical protein BDP27DRAFT_1337936 [Rhodocollybia butyracea]|uniref:Uncharacterized protein n=1 Tax=Rhodocollybia butyracea TaxID=206335 RepID=A0A9P5PDX5_9AGAR|nr:hypothetical protein BDP27DRAFT_1337936 [Rhodocollybia butyracea]